MSGPGYLVTSACAFAVMATLVHEIRPEVHVSIIVWSRLFISLCMSGWALRATGVPMVGQRTGGLLLRGLIGAGALSCYFISLRELPLAQATTIQNAAPLLVAALAHGLLGERSSPSVWVAIVLGVVGVAITGEVWRYIDSGSHLGILSAIGGAVLAAAAYVTIRELTKTEHPLRIVFFFPVVALPLTTPWAWQHLQPLTWIDIALLLGVGVTTQLGQLSMTRGMATVDAGRASAFGFLQIPLAMVLGIALGETPTGMVVIGAAIILGGQAMLHMEHLQATASRLVRYALGGKSN